MDSVTFLSTRIGDVIAGSDHAARVLIARGMHCVGCPFAPFETVADVAAAYGIEPSELARALDDRPAPSGVEGRAGGTFQ